MPIKGLSERRRFSRGGKIRLGEKKVSAKGAEYPSKLDHFLADFDDPEVEKEFYTRFGPEPKRIQIAFPSEDPEQVFPQYYKCYGASGLLCKGDGDKALQRSSDEHQAELLEIDCPGPDECAFAMARKDKGGRPGCNKVASLVFFIPALPVMQVFQIDTKSYNSIVNINSQLEVLRTCCGRIGFIPVDLVLKPQQATNPETGKKVNIFVLDLVVGVGLAQIGKLRPLIAGPPTEARVELPAPSEDLPDDLYPASVTRAQAAAKVKAEESVEIDAETGEVLSAPDEPEPDDLSQDPDVQRAFDQAGFPPAKRRAMLASAETKEQLLHIISVNAANNTPANGDAKPAPATKPQTKPEAASAPKRTGARLF